MDVFRVFQVEAAHYLPNVPDGHKCARMHGHSFRIEIHVSGHAGEDSGWVMDFADLRRAFQPLFDQLDHHCLNEVEGLENPTSENLARWILATSVCQPSAAEQGDGPGNLQRRLYLYRRLILPGPILTRRSNQAGKCLDVKG